MAGHCAKQWTKIQGIWIPVLFSQAWLLAGFLSLYFICRKVKFISVMVTASMPCLLEQTSSTPSTEVTRRVQNIQDLCLGTEVLSLLQAKESLRNIFSVQSIFLHNAVFCIFFQSLPISAFSCAGVVRSLCYSTALPFWCGDSVSCCSYRTRAWPAI